MKISNKADVLQYVCGAIFAVFAWNALSGIVAEITQGYSVSLLVSLANIFNAGGLALMAVACFLKKRDLCTIGFGVRLVSVLVRIIALPKLILLLKLSNVLSIIIYGLGIAVCIAPEKFTKKLSYAMIAAYVLSVVCTISTYRADYLPVYFRLNAGKLIATIIAYYFLGFVFHSGQQDLGLDIPFLKNLPKVTFREAWITFVASFLISIPIALVFCIASTTLGLIAIIVFPVAFTIADIKDKPLREKREAEQSRWRTKLFAMQFEESFRRGENPITSAPTINTDRLRNDLMNHYGTAMHNGFPMAQADLVHVQGASDEELIREAKKCGFNMNKYME